ncbi:hypothetical protein [Cellulomonas sp. PSBB021]|uniref:hypothetical protein n=1 Tax=Cellulomonas sp. PSBB021 TaxID=2003551 RepID=UPI0012FD7E36|nr:hypothetical protein [Cellulomonas sp. PSBB021]
MATEFFRVLDEQGRTNAPVAWTDDHRMFVWVPNTRAWHRSRELETDFLVERELTFEPLPAADVPDAMSGAQRIDERSAGWLVEEYRNQPADDRRTSADLGLRIAGERSTTSSVLVERLASTSGWVVVKTYANGGRAAERSAASLASDIRRGQRKALSKLGPLEARVAPAGGDLVVEARRAL